MPTTTNRRVGIIAGDINTFFIKKDGTVYACGRNSYYSLGTGNGNAVSIPVKIPIENVKTLTTNAADLAPYTIFLKEDGTVWGCGYNGYGQLGLGNTTNMNTITEITTITDVKDVVAGGYHTFFIKNDGNVWACGQNNRGQLGIGNTTNQTTLVKVPITNVADIATGGDDGGYHTIFIKTDGTVWGCGFNGYGQLADGTTTDSSTIKKYNITDVIAAAASSDDGGTCLFLKSDGTVWGCGYNGYGQLGLNNTTNQTAIVQIPITNVIDVQIGAMCSLFLKEDGTVWGCGRNKYGELGLKNTTDQRVPVQIPITDVIGMTVNGDDASYECAYYYRSVQDVYYT